MMPSPGGRQTSGRVSSIFTVLHLEAGIASVVLDGMGRGRLCCTLFETLDTSQFAHWLPFPMQKQGGEGADGSGAAPAAPPQQQQQQQQAGSGGAPKRGPGAGSGRSAVATMIGGLKAAQEMQDK